MAGNLDKIMYFCRPAYFHGYGWAESEKLGKRRAVLQLEIMIQGGIIHPISSESFEDGYIIIKMARFWIWGRRPFR